MEPSGHRIPLKSGITPAGTSTRDDRAVDVGASGSVTFGSMDRYSYTSTPSSVYNRLREIGQLFRMARKPIGGSVSWTMGLYEGTKSRVKSSTGVVLTGMKGLEMVPTGVTQKLETPVLYFYSQKAQKVNVHVEFPQGVR